MISITSITRQMLLASALVMAAAGGASGRIPASAAINETVLPYFAAPQERQPLGQFAVHTHICLTGASFTWNGLQFLQFVLPNGGVVYSPVSTVAITRDPAGNANCALQSASVPEVPSIPAPVQRAPQPAPNYATPSAASSAARQRPVMATQPAPKYTLTPQDESKYTAVLEKILKQDSAGWVQNKYIPNTVNGIHVIYDKDSGEVLGLRASYRFIDGFCPYADNDLTCNKSGWVIAKLDSKPTCLVYWDDKDTCRPVTEHDAAYKLLEALKNAPPQHSQPRSESPIEHGLKCAWVADSPMMRGLNGCW